MNPIGAAIIAVVAMMILIASRRNVALALLAGVMFLPMSQQIHLGGFNLFPMRLLGFLAFLRVMGRGEFSFSSMNRMDKTLVFLLTYGAIIYAIRSATGVANAVGTALDGIFAYLACRGLIQDMDELREFLKKFIVLLFLFIPLVADEMLSHSNPYSFMGGVNFGWFRNGRMRCFGPFQNPDLLGTLGATFLPFYCALAWQKENRKMGVLAIIGCLFLIFACNSGGPTSATMMGIVAWMFWRFRTKMAVCRRWMLIFLGVLAVVMKAPIYYLPAKVSDITGGDGWHRSYLMDVSFKHLQEWWMVGMPLENTVDWFPYILSTTGTADIPNQYVVYGLKAGVVMVVIFVVLLNRGYHMLGAALSTVRARSEWVTADEVMLWGMGVMLTTHVTNFFGISYFDQSFFFWSLQLALISTLSQRILDTPPEEKTAETSREDATMGAGAVIEYQPLH